MPTFTYTAEKTPLKPASVSGFSRMIPTHLALDMAGTPDAAIVWHNVNNARTVSGEPEAQRHPVVANFTLGAAGGNVVEDFVLLARTDEVGGYIHDDVRVFRFAQRYGPLLLCSHGLPFVHDTFKGLREKIKHAAETAAMVADAGERCTPVACEPITIWRAYAKLADRLLRIQARLLDSQPPEVADVDGAIETFRALGIQKQRGALFPKIELTPENRPAAQYLYAEMTDACIAMAGIRPRFQWWGDERYFGFRTAGVFGEIVWQIIRQSLGVKGVAVCAGCGNLFFIDSPLGARGRRKGDSQWCPACGPKAANRASKRRQRERKKLRLEE